MDLLECSDGNRYCWWSFEATCGEWFFFPFHMWWYFRGFSVSFLSNCIWAQPKILRGEWEWWLEALIGRSLIPRSCVVLSQPLNEIDWMDWWLSFWHTALKCPFILQFPQYSMKAGQSFLDMFLTSWVNQPQPLHEQSPGLLCWCCTFPCLGSFVAWQWCAQSHEVQWLFCRFKTLKSANFCCKSRKSNRFRKNTRLMLLIF